MSHLHTYSDPLLSSLFKSLWKWIQSWVFLGRMLQVWHTFIWGVSPILLYISSQTLSGWMGSVTAQLFSGLSRDDWSGSSLGSGWATQGHSDTCPKATLVLSWLCAYGRCPVGRWTFTPVWGLESSGWGFYQVSLFTLLHSSFPWYWLVSPSLLLKNIPTAW